MNYNVYIRGTAERDVSEAMQWYEKQQSGLATEFNAEFEATIELLEETPLIYPQLYREVHRAVMHRFPFLVWFRVNNRDVTVLACTHGKADPSNLPQRLA